MEDGNGIGNIAVSHINHHDSDKNIGAMIFIANRFMLFRFLCCCYIDKLVSDSPPHLFPLPRGERMKGEGELNYQELA